MQTFLAPGQVVTISRLSQGLGTDSSKAPGQAIQAVLVPCLAKLSDVVGVEFEVFGCTTGVGLQCLHGERQGSVRHWGSEW